MAKRKALGRGLSALLSEDNSSVNSAKDKGAEQVVGSVLVLNLDDIEVNPYQPRTVFDSTALKELSESIKELGVIQPITVRKQDDVFQLVSGERRFRASKMAGINTIPAYVRLADDQQMLEMALVENIQRQDLDAIEIALSYQRLIDEISLTQEQMSKRVGKNRTTITNYLRLLKLPPQVQNAIRDGKISMGHGRALITLEDQNKQLELLDKIIKEDLSVRQVESLVSDNKQAKPKESNTTKKKPLPNSHKVLIKRLSDKLEADVELSRSQKGKGKIVISFNSDGEFDRIKDLLV